LKYVFVDVSAFKLKTMNEVAEFSSCAPCRAVVTSARNSPFILNCNWLFLSWRQRNSLGFELLDKFFNLTNQIFLISRAVSVVVFDKCGHFISLLYNYKRT